MNNDTLHEPVHGYNTVVNHAYVYMYAEVTCACTCFCNNYIYVLLPLQTSSSNVENLPPTVIRQISKEVVELAANPPEGIKLFINEEDITDIQATIEGPGNCNYI